MMTPDRRPGCLRLLVGSMFGGLVGIGSACLIGYLDAPEVNPADPLEHEGYTPYVLLVLIPGGLLAGIVMGTIASSMRSGLTWKSIAGGTAGWLLAMAGGWILFRGREAGVTLHGLLTCVATAVGFALAANHFGPGSRRPEEPWGIEMAATLFEDRGVRFQYPEGWDVEVTDEGAITTVALHAPEGLAFALVSIDPDRPMPSEVADKALEAMREEYASLEATPAVENVDGRAAVGHDAEFISLDMTNTCTIRCFETDRRTVLIFAQASDLADDDAGQILASLRDSFEETDD